MIKTYDVFYKVIISDIVDAHYCPGPDTELPKRYETEQEAKIAAKKWEEDHKDLWKEAWVKRFMVEVK